MPILAELEHLTVHIVVTISTHLIHHEVFLILELAKYHGKHAEKLRQAVNVRVFREISIEDLVVRPVEVIGFKHINNLERKDTASFGIYTLLFDLVTGEICQELLFCL